MSSPYTPRVRSKLSQCLTADRSLSESSSDISDEGPMTQSDMTLSQNTFQATQEPLACNEDEIFDSLVNTEAAPTLNRVVDVSRFETESNRDEQEGEDNLMDEELSMVDNSFSQEEATASVPPPTTTEILAPLEQITTLEEFMKATGTQYMAEVPTSFRRETNAFALDAATPTHADYAKAASVWFPELEIYEFGCKELSQYIEEGSATQKEREAEIAASTPIIFYEVIEGTDEEKKDLIVSFDEITGNEHC